MAPAAESSRSLGDLTSSRLRSGSQKADNLANSSPTNSAPSRTRSEPRAAPALTCPRSVSLPQALHSTHIAPPPAKLRQSRPFLPENRKLRRDSSAQPRHLLSTPSTNDEELRQISDPASSRHADALLVDLPTRRPLGRSETAPRLHFAKPASPQNEDWVRQLAPSPVPELAKLEEYSEEHPTSIWEHAPYAKHAPCSEHWELSREHSRAHTREHTREHPRAHTREHTNFSPIPTPLSAVERALSSPDILYCILSALDAMSVVPREITHQRCKPLSLRHAQLMFGNDQAALDAWESRKNRTTTEGVGAGIYSCLLVSKRWHSVAVRILESKIYFSSVERFTQFVRRRAPFVSRRPRMLVLHKLAEATQVELDMLEPYQLGEQLEWLEFYTCAGLAPNRSLLGSSLRNIVLPGCFRVNDRTLASIGECCPQLEYLDVRACEQISDRGIKIIAKRCPQLQLLNVGRNRSGELITYKAIKHLARQTQISSLGLAGCCIDDRAIWELALNRGPYVQRLSLNNCHLLTDASIPRVLGYMPNLNVLEIRGCTSITHMRPLALYRAYRERRGPAPLIDGCEIVERRLQAAILRLRMETTNRVLSDLTTYINNDDE